MARVHLGEAAFADLVRLEEFVWRLSDPGAYALLAFILDALQVLTHQPGIGRPVEGALRELIIKRGHSGYLAKYEYDAPTDRVRVLRVRDQRQAGYSIDAL